MDNKLGLKEIDGIVYMPYYQHEKDVVRLHKLIKNIVIAFLVAIVAIVGIFMIAWRQYDYFDTEQEEVVDIDSGSGTANYIGNDGGIINGENNSYQNNTDTETSTQE